MSSESMSANSEPSATLPIVNAIANALNYGRRKWAQCLAAHFTATWHNVGVQHGIGN
jgi:hypothetical protein